MKTAWFFAIKKACFLALIAFLYYAFVHQPIVTLTQLSISYVIFVLPKLYSLELVNRTVTKAALIEVTHFRKYLITEVERVWRKNFALFILLTLFTNVIILSPDFRFQIELFSYVGNRVGAIDGAQAVRFFISFFLLTEFFQTCADIFHQHKLNRGIDLIIQAQERLAEMIAAENEAKE